MASKQEVDAYRKQVKSALTHAQAEIASHLQKIDKMGEYELAELKGVTGSLAAFFDKNGSCAAGMNMGNKLRTDLLSSAIFDKNGSCGSSPGSIGSIGKK